jgi:Lon protease-like protein
MSEPDRAALPDTLPIFPLTGVLLLPRGRLPLNIFEPRYLAMTRDALGGERLIGMVQPSEPQKDNRGGGAVNPPVYPIGCAGRITAFSETDDGRYLLTLTGVSRFRIRDELPLLSGYRRVVAEWQPFARDVDTPTGAEFDRDRFIRGLKGFFTQRQISADWEAIEKAAGEHLINSIAMLCPFAPSEKQALLEAADLDERARLLIALVEMAAVNPAQSFSAEESGATRH